MPYENFNYSEIMTNETVLKIKCKPVSIAPDKSLYKIKPGNEISDYCNRIRVH